MLSTYRPDIDGLRAIAVISVILCHAQIQGFTGGFVGVDIFFVISGFLISSILLRELATDTFSFANFYVRRVRRILPALLVLLFFTAIMAWFLLLPNDYRRFGKGLIASILMIPNIAAWSASGNYFAATADSNPLLHLWSLGVEEQFYLLFPLMLWFFVDKFSLRICWLLLITIAVLSLALAFWAASNQPGFGFYWLPTRTWEFLLGIGIASYQASYRHKLLNLRSCSELLALAGIMLILFSITASQGATLGSSTPYQISACLGAVILISTGFKQQTWVHKGLALKPVVGIGLISYSLYLWHWPLLSFLSYWQDGLKIKGKDHMILIVLALSLVLAALSWKYIEQPFRNKQRWQTGPLIRTALAVQTLLLGLGTIFWLTQGVPQRFSPNQLQYAKGQMDSNPLQKDCIKDGTTAISTKFNPENCFIGNNPSQLPRFIVWGDSHSNAVTPAFIELAKQYNVTGVQASLGAGGALLNLQILSKTKEWNHNWQNFNKSILTFLQNQPSITDVFLVTRWNAYALDQTEYEASVANGEIAKAAISYHDEYDSFKAFQLSLRATITQLNAQGKRTWLVMPIPEVGRNVPRWLTHYERENKDVWVTGYPLRRTALLPIFKQIQAEYHVRLIDPADILCRHNNSECRITAHGNALYSDDNHVTATGAVFISDIFRPAFDLMQQGK